jgi:hypothetical protein
VWTNVPGGAVKCLAAGGGEAHRSDDAAAVASAVIPSYVLRVDGKCGLGWFDDDEPEPEPEPTPGLKSMARLPPGPLDTNMGLSSLLRVQM